MRRLLALLAALVLLTACTSSADKPVPPNPASKPKQGGNYITIRITTDGSRMLDPVISAFQEKYPRYRVVQVPTPNGPDVAEQFTAALKEGKADVLYLPSSTPEWIQEMSCSSTRT